jgi:predicted nucleic acid-binding protein
MRFWDSSALISLLIVDTHSARADAIVRADGVIVSSFITPIEISSALWRRRHARQFSVAEHTVADERFAALSRRWSTIHDVERVVDGSLSLLTRYPLRTGDAIQLAAAVVARDEVTELEFVTFDNRLATAARAEGFAVLA